MLDVPSDKMLMSNEYSSPYSLFIVYIQFGYRFIQVSKIVYTMLGDISVLERCFYICLCEYFIYV